MYDDTRRDASNPGTSRKAFGKYKGIVKDNNDLTKSGKLEVIVPDIHGTKRLWAQPCVPYADRGHGFFFMPPNETEVWVEFAGGERDQPIWTGFLWPKGGAPSPTPGDMVLSTPSGKLTLKAENKAPQVTLQTETLKLELSDGTVTIEASEGAKLEITKDGSVTAASGAKGKVEITKSATNINGTSLEVT